MFILARPCPAVTNFCAPPHQIIHSHIVSPIPTHMWVNKLFSWINWRFSCFRWWFFPPIYAHPLPSWPTTPLFPVIPGQWTHTKPSVIISDHPWPSLTITDFALLPISMSLNIAKLRWSCLLPAQNIYMLAPECTDTFYFWVPSTSPHPYVGPPIHTYPFLIINNLHWHVPLNRVNIEIYDFYILI